MKVANIMQRDVDFVTTNTSVRDVARIIFGHRINGLPVCQNRKVVGFVTERDILAKFYPNMTEFMEDPLEYRNFELLEEKADEILRLPVSKIMSRSVTTIKAETPILKAQSLMQVKKVGRLPVVDGKGNLIGIVAKGDIFRAAIGRGMPRGTEEKFYDWLSKHYDLIIDFKKRLDAEIPDIVRVLKKEGAKTVIDVASSTGEHVIALARQGFDSSGVESSTLMTRTAEGKRSKLQGAVKNRARFFSGRYNDIIFKLPINIDSALFLGNTIPHVLYTEPKILNEVNRTLNPKKATMIFQIVNFNKLLKKNNGMEEFIVRDSSMAYEEKHAFLGFYTPIKSTNELIFTQSIFDFDSAQWVFSGMGSTRVVRVEKADMEKILKKLGFNNIKFYGSKMYEPLFKKPFDPEESDYLNIIAKRA